jgi:hypothetical protein
MRMKFKTGIVGVAVGLYVITYLTLSIAGRYEPGSLGASGVKWYYWAPKGFVTGNGDVRSLRWRQGMLLTFGPLFWLDTRTWHTQDKVHGGRYRINDIYERNAEPDGAANRSQPVRPETNRASATAGSGR